MGHQPYPARTNHEVFEFVIHGGRNEKVEGTPNAMYVCCAYASFVLATAVWCIENITVIPFVG